MIFNVNTIRCAAGKRPEAKDFLARWVEKCNKANPETKRYILQPINGEISEILLVGIMPSLTAMDEWRKKRQADPELQALMKEVNDSEWYLGRKGRQFEVVE